MSDRRVLVIGTTPDYIAHIYARDAGRALFITDRVLRCGSSEPKPDEASEVVCDLSRIDEVVSSMQMHLSRWGLIPSGVACYDCERLGLAATIARLLRLPYPSLQSVQLCRNKYLSKLRWSECSVRCPQTELVREGYQAVRFLERLGRAIVLKPLTGSGSELTFRCEDRNGALRAFRALKIGLQHRRRSPLYRREEGGGTLDPTDVIVAEELAEGREYSCDFIIDNSDVQIIRIASKVRDQEYPFGTTVAYLLPSRLQSRFDSRFTQERLRQAAGSLGLTRAICMVDFMAVQDEIVLLELTPRIGGDCLPPLIRQSCGMDMLEVALDFAEGRRPTIPPAAQWRSMVGLRLFSRCGGVVKTIDTSSLLADDQVVEVHVKRSTGHRVTLPPEDYDSWLLGHVIFRPRPDEFLTHRCQELRSKLVVEMEPYYNRRCTGHDASSHKSAESANTTA